MFFANIKLIEFKGRQRRVVVRMRRLRDGEGYRLLAIDQGGNRWPEQDRYATDLDAANAIKSEVCG